MTDKYYIAFIPSKQSLWDRIRCKHQVCTTTLIFDDDAVIVDTRHNIEMITVVPLL